MCASAAAQIFASLPKGQRLIMPHAHILIHQPLTSSGTYINSSNIKNMAYFLKSIENMVYQDLANWTGQLLSQITKDCAKETWLQGQEAIDYGLADHLYSRKTLKELEKSVNE
jgi:ATP-dependent Clp protease protease subunit